MLAFKFCNCLRLSDYGPEISSKFLILQSLIVLSPLPEAKYLPSGENATDKITELWPCSVVTYFCNFTLQSLTVLSKLPEAKYLPSGENAIEKTHELWPCSVVTSFFDSTLQSLTVSS
jgi:hypothetical protein